MGPGRSELSGQALLGESRAEAQRLISSNAVSEAFAAGQFDESTIRPSDHRTSSRPIPFPRYRSPGSPLAPFAISQSGQAQRTAILELNAQGVSRRDAALLDRNH